jgi:hypothetical protein
LRRPTKRRWGGSPMRSGGLPASERSIPFSMGTTLRWYAFSPSCCTNELTAVTPAASRQIHLATPPTS